MAIIVYIYIYIYTFIKERQDLPSMEFRTVKYIIQNQMLL